MSIKVGEEKMRDILDLCCQYGFPMVMCLLIYFENNKTIESLKESINKNTSTMEKILLEVMKNDVP